MKYPNVYVKLVGEDGNAFSILARVSNALKKAGVSKEEISQFQKEAMSNDYNHLLNVVQYWVNANWFQKEAKQQHTLSLVKLMLSYQNKRRQDE